MTYFLAGTVDTDAFLGRDIGRFYVSERRGEEATCIWQDLTAPFCGYDVNPHALHLFAHHVTCIPS